MLRLMWMAARRLFVTFATMNCKLHQVTEMQLEQAVLVDGCSLAVTFDVYLNCLVVKQSQV